MVGLKNKKKQSMKLNKENIIVMNCHDDLPILIRCVLLCIMSYCLSLFLILKKVWFCGFIIPCLINAILECRHNGSWPDIFFKSKWWHFIFYQLYSVHQSQNSMAMVHLLDNFWNHMQYLSLNSRIDIESIILLLLYCWLVIIWQTM